MPSNQSARSIVNRSDTPCDCAFCWATARAAADISLATPVASGRSASRVTARTPVPVPRSRSRAKGSLQRRFDQGFGFGPRHQSVARYPKRAPPELAVHRSTLPRARVAGAPKSIAWNSAMLSGESFSNSRIRTRSGETFMAWANKSRASRPGSAIPPAFSRAIASAKAAPTFTLRTRRASEPDRRRSARQSPRSDRPA